MREGRQRDRAWVVAPEGSSRLQAGARSFRHNSENHTHKRCCRGCEYVFVVRDTCRLKAL